MPDSLILAGVVIGALVLALWIAWVKSYTPPMKWHADRTMRQRLLWWWDRATLPIAHMWGWCFDEWSETSRVWRVVFVAVCGVVGHIWGPVQDATAWINGDDAAEWPVIGRHCWRCGVHEMTTNA